MIVDNEIKKLNSVYDSVRVDKYCIMPDHIHFILSIDTDENFSLTYITLPLISFKQTISHFAIPKKAEGRLQKVSALVDKEWRYVIIKIKRSVFCAV
jgi:REP element-mobilizing transposase RayT